jgi:hypothetical protein
MPRVLLIPLRLQFLCSFYGLEISFDSLLLRVGHLDIYIEV